jgi:hypothetical protein
MTITEDHRVGDVPPGPKLLAATYDRAVPRTVDRWVFMVREWAGRQWDDTPEAAYDLVYDVIAVAGPNRSMHLGELFDHLARQWAGGHQKLNSLRKYRDRMKAKPQYWPQLKPMRATRSEARAAKVVALMQANLDRHWTVSQLARKLRTPISTMHYLTMEMRIRGLIVRVDEGRGLLGLPRPYLKVRKSVSRQIIEKLIAAGDDGIGFVALRDAIGCNISHQMYDLRKIGVLAPSTHAGCWTRPEEGGPPIRLGAPVRLSADAIAKIARGQPIRNGRRTLWAPTDAGRC